LLREGFESRHPQGWSLSREATTGFVTIAFTQMVPTSLGGVYHIVRRAGSSRQNTNKIKVSGIGTRSASAYAPAAEPIADFLFSNLVQGTDAIDAWVDQTNTS
jgi:hypothetical protein